MRYRTVRWIRERWRDTFLWPRNLLRDLPQRLQRLVGGHTSNKPVIPLLPQEAPFSGRRVRLHTHLAHLFDLVGGPEIVQYAMHLFMYTTPLSRVEQQAITSVLGFRAIRYEDVRVAEGGILPLVFRHNGGRAFCTWHTIHLSREGPHRRENLSLLVHEATHVMQYERHGSRYLGEALFAQRRLGRGAYDYGGEEGLREASKAGMSLAVFNREAQAQIAQDYYRRSELGLDTGVYEPFVSAIRAGAF